uniref:peptidylprolyl isomerase n=1 Tax=Pseudodiaptomus poplesia TaxID=213370 RepID=A0A0U2V9F4_9MAXI|nr:FKBP-type peptidyl-prolyl cis-trans isomerase-12 [Pseudodiaptomus poplesia]
MRLCLTLGLILAITVCSGHDMKGPFRNLRTRQHHQDPFCVEFTFQENLPEETVQIITYGAPEVSAYLAMGLSGDGKTFPQAGDTVTAHYALYLADCQFIESSREYGDPFSFTIGTGEVIAGWDVGLMQMSLGQRASMTLSADMAYGDQGAGGGVIPPNAVLIFDVEIVAIDRP